MHLDPYFCDQHTVVSENYLEAMLAYMNSMSHRYWIEKVTDNFCYVAYSNPNEYGVESVIQCLFPVYRMKDRPGTVSVVLDVYNVVGGRDAFDRDENGMSILNQLLDVPRLYRNPVNGEWATALCLDHYLATHDSSREEDIGVQGRTD